MKKILLTFCAAVLALTAAAGTTPGLQSAWANIIDGPTAAGDQATDVAIGKKGGVYWLGNYGSNDADGLDISYAGEVIFSGAAYSGTSNNGNLTLIKTDADGNRQWVVYSNSGDFANNSGGVVPTADGGAVVVAKVRHTDGYTDRNIALVDATGAKTEAQWTCERRYYRMMIFKVTAEGAISWLRMADASTEPREGATGHYVDFWADTFNLNKVAGDDSDNIYIALNYRTPFTFAKADGTVTLTPTGTGLQTWNGDSQNTVGDFLLLGLDADGYYRNSLTLEGTSTATYCQDIEFDNGKLYVLGYAKSDGTPLKAGDISMATTSDGVFNPIIMSTDTSLKPLWAKCLKGEAVGGKQGYQNCGITAVGGTLWLCGQYNLKITDPGEAAKTVASSQGSVREGFIIKFDAADGTWLAARNSRDDDWNEPVAQAKTGLTGYFKVLQNPTHTNYIYVYGYVMNANVGVFLRRYDATTLEGDLAEGQNNIVTKGGVPSSQVIAYDEKDGSAYLTARGNQAFGLYDGSTTAAPVKWGILAAKVELPADMTTGIEGIEADDTDAAAEYYNLQGIRVANPSNGIFIRRQGSRTTKVAL